MMLAKVDGFESSSGIGVRGLVEGKQLALGNTTLMQQLGIATTTDGESSLPVEGFTALVGRGVQGKIDGETFALGNHRLIEERLQCSDADGRQRGNRKSAGCAIGH